MNNLTFGNARVQYYETICSGSPAGIDAKGQGFDGTAGVHVHMTNTRLTDPEVLELRYPVVVEELLDPARLGRQGALERAATARERVIRFLEPMDCAILSGYRRVRPFGLLGGEPGEMRRKPRAPRATAGSRASGARLRPKSRPATPSSSGRRRAAASGRADRGLARCVPGLNLAYVGNIPDLYAARRFERSVPHEIDAPSAVSLLALSLGSRGGAHAEENVSPDADFTVREITQALFKAQPGEQLNYSGHDLTYLDLSGLDFKQATLEPGRSLRRRFHGRQPEGRRPFLCAARPRRAHPGRPFGRQSARHDDLPADRLLGPADEAFADAPHFSGADLTRHPRAGGAVGRGFPRRQSDVRQLQPARSAARSRHARRR